MGRMKNLAYSCWEDAQAGLTVGEIATAHSISPEFVKQLTFQWDMLEEQLEFQYDVEDWPDDNQDE